MVTVTKFTTEFSVWQFVIHSIFVEDVTKQLNNNSLFSDIGQAMVTECFGNKVDESVYLGHLASKWNVKNKGYKVRKPRLPPSLLQISFG